MLYNDCKRTKGVVTNQEPSQTKELILTIIVFLLGFEFLLKRFPIKRKLMLQNDQNGIKDVAANHELNRNTT